MNLPMELQQAADALLDAFRRTEAFQTYDTLQKSVMADEVNRRLLARFTRAQSALQMAAMAGSEPREEDTREFEKLSALLYENEEIADYLLAQMKVQQMVAELLDGITREAGICVEMKEG